MLLVDYREGSHDLVKPLQRLGLEVEETTLEFGDIAFIGRGEKGVPVSIGIEFKTLRECVGSLRTERLQGHQMVGMVGAHGLYDFGYLLIEGELLYDERGYLQCWGRRGKRRELKPIQGQMTIAEFSKRLNVLHLRGGLNPWLTAKREHSLKWLEMLYRTWTDTDLDKHGSHLAIYRPPPPLPVSEFRAAVSAWPTIGYRTSKAVEDQFGGSLKRAVNASAATWANINITDDRGHSRKLGEKDAARIMQFIEGL